MSNLGFNPQNAREAEEVLDCGPQRRRPSARNDRPLASLLKPVRFHYYLRCAGRNAVVVLAAAVLYGTAPMVAGGQQNQGGSSSKKAQSKTNNNTATKNAPDQPMWDPLRAEKDMEVGKYYMHKGDLDAAMDRFQDAAKAKPGFAIPFRYLGECQEKKGMKREAIRSYTRYLDLYPHADDATKIQKKIDKLWKEVKEKKKPEF